METNTPSGVNKPLKRFACDRCKSRKIRCPRPDDDETKACTRCIRSGVPCLTSATKPSGRPRTAASRVQKLPGPEPTGGHLTVGRSDLLPSPSLTDFLVAAAAPSVIPASTMATRNETSSQARARIHQAQGYGMFNYSADTRDMMDVILIGGPGNLDHLLPALGTSFSSSSSSSSSSPSPSSQPSSTSFVASASTPHPIMRSDISHTVQKTCSNSAPRQANAADTGLLLASLYHNLCRQMSSLETAPLLDPAHLDIVTSIIGGMSTEKLVDPGQDAELGDNRSRETNPLSAILRSMIELVELCRMVAALHDVFEDAGHHRRRRRRRRRRSSTAGSLFPGRLSASATSRRETGDQFQQPPAPLPLPLPTGTTAQLVLTLLSSYLQTVSVCESLLSRLFTALAGEDGASSQAGASGQAGTPRSCSATGGGVPLMMPMHHHRTRKLLLRLFAQTVEYYLEQVEETLGMPKDYRVTKKGGDDHRDKVVEEKGDRRDATEESGPIAADDGLLSGRRGKALIAAVMWKSSSNEQEMEEEEWEPIIYEGVLVVEALRACLRRVYSC